RPFGILPDLLTGDLDSIRGEDRSWIEQSQVPVNQYSPEKDFTDSELAVESAFKLLETDLCEKGLHRPANRAITICLLAATGDRPDHVLGNQLMAGRLARSQYDVMLSDGRNWFYLMEGPASRTYDTSAYPEDFTVSVVSLSEQVRGITYRGLKYPLDNYNLNFGSQRGISNSLEYDSASQFEIRIVSGTLMVIITKAD
ncbi:MAG: thiamine diphosphokinase, partial [Clostridiaceae bacterium]|nr:thiamine diphosphokinase [Clostridiaceae bacterium]